MQISLRSIVAMVFAVCCSMTFADAIPDRLGTPIDLSSFSGMDSVLDEAVQAPDTDATPIVPVDSRGHAVWIRPYVTGIVGASFGTINAGGSLANAQFIEQYVGSVNEAMFTGGGAIGMAIDRPSGLLRMEVEGRARGPMSGQTNDQLVIGGTTVVSLPTTTTATNGWSAMTNFWRDYFFTDRLGAYGGGGFGIGGYQYAVQGLGNDPFETFGGSNAVNTFAWQVGTGITYQLNDRVTFDIGYRFFAMTPGLTPVTFSSPANFEAATPTTSAFSASELLLSIRIYEPFRNWR